MILIKATIITIGDELLIGQTIDTNSAWIAQQLNAMGIDVTRRVAVGDNRDAIINALDEEARTADILLLTGGLGPTSDDITKPLLNEYFGGKMVVNERVLAHVQEIFSRRNRPFLERNIKQAEVPDVCEVLFNQLGTAPGMWFEKEGKIYVSMPGVPFEMEGIMQDEVLPRFRKKFSSEAIVHRTIITGGEGESFIAERIKNIEETLPQHIRLAYLPSAGMVKLRLTGHGGTEDALTAEVESWQKKLAGQLQDITLAMEDLSTEEILGRSLRAHHTTLGLAESCTGGYIAHKLTQIPGSSEYFTGSIVCYDVRIKEEILGISRHLIESEGVVSEAVALEMAHKARTLLGTDIGFGVTGVLSSSNDYPMPAGTVCMAVCGKDGRVVSRTLRFHYDRIRNKEMAAQMGLLMIWKFLHHKI
ncbi:CinA family nicotinamide mononucleotide deamidase-related protein [Chitinophagaceae bacterium MMS25-I14]